jgi:hypothetical protein
VAQVLPPEPAALNGYRKKSYTLHERLNALDEYAVTLYSYMCSLPNRLHGAHLRG